jgi:hypothetical protein
MVAASRRPSALPVKHPSRINCPCAERTCSGVSTLGTGLARSSAAMTSGRSRSHVRFCSNVFRSSTAPAPCACSDRSRSSSLRHAASCSSLAPGTRIVVLGCCSGAVGLARAKRRRWRASSEKKSRRDFEGYSGMLVFFTFMPIGIIVGAVLGAAGLAYLACRPSASS